jgi:hypothetical protein
MLLLAGVGIIVEGIVAFRRGDSYLGVAIEFDRR